MNPPFHLRKNTNIKYKKDYFDYDFVKRAFGMLSENGVLVAIMGVDYLKNENIIKWFKEHNFIISKPEKHKFNENAKTESAKIDNAIPIVFVKVTKSKLFMNSTETNELLKIDEFNVGKNIDTDFIKNQDLVNGKLYEEEEINKIINQVKIDDEEVKNIMNEVKALKPKEKEKEMTIIPKSKKPNVIIEEEKPMTENETILNEWKDKFLGTIISTTKIGKNISNLINKKNKKSLYVDDVGLISFLKPITDKIVETYGVDELFKGIDKIADYFDVNNYNKTFGTMEYLPIKDYFNVKNVKLIQQRNKELYEKSLKPYDAPEKKKYYLRYT